MDRIQSSGNFRLRFLIIFFFSLIGMVAPANMSADDMDKTETEIFDKNFKTLRIWNPDYFMGIPVIRLNTNDRLLVSFDEIADDRSFLRCRLIHCNSDWSPSSLVESEYSDGFNFEDIEDFGFSSNTFVHYVNYHVEIPSENLRPLVSGNYILQVFDRDDPDDILLQVRFYVSEDLAAIGGNVTSRTDIGVNDLWQQLYVDADIRNLGSINPYQDLKLVVQQNRRPETTRVITHPLSTSGSVVKYGHDRSLIFPASNEYRRFETVRADYPGMHTDSVRFEGSNYHAYLSPDTPRADANYVFDSTQKGRYLIRQINASDSDLGADYVTVHFSLVAPFIPDGDVFIDGDLTNNNFSEGNKMIYDHTTGSYNIKLPLKQGSYNYQYVVKDRDGRMIPDPGIIEGNKHETLNEYDGFLYLRTPGARFDRLVGSFQIVMN